MTVLLPVSEVSIVRSIAHPTYLLVLFVLGSVYLMEPINVSSLLLELHNVYYTLLPGLEVEQIGVHGFDRNSLPRCPRVAGTKCDSIERLVKQLIDSERYVRGFARRTWD